MFGLRGAPGQVAKRLGISRTGLYTDLAELRRPLRDRSRHPVRPRRRRPGGPQRGPPARPPGRPRRPLRLHVKTAKSVEVARRVHGDCPITASTLAEAEHSADAGYRDILYAVGIAPHKLPRVAALLRRGVTLTVLLDTPCKPRRWLGSPRRKSSALPALVEIDCDGHRGGGVVPADPALVEIGRALGPHLAGVLTHAGESYFASSREAQREAAAQERDAAVEAATTLRDASLPCAIVSVGSTPTAHAATDLTGVTEVRAGNFVFFDLVMASIGVCSTDDLALSVVVTVIGHQPDRNRVLTDGGWMATSRDRGTQVQAVDQGYGLVTDLDGRLVPTSS
ncbi:hypothetical protein GCM10009836_44920 [Pseudonocardia ailaonensis]|uniref:Alanine racemase n=1 Tax=Pseudonocardia ailaonensis TaxID=367279 RepID=A0ABN2NA10_9PSEU